jgi:hypothetical protein
VIVATTNEPVGLFAVAPVEPLIATSLPIDKPCGTAVTTLTKDPV